LVDRAVFDRRQVLSFGPSSTNSRCDLVNSDTFGGGTKAEDKVG